MISQTEQGHKQFPCEGRVVVEKEGMVLHHIKIGYKKHYR